MGQTREAGTKEGGTPSQWGQRSFPEGVEGEGLEQADEKVGQKREGIPGRGFALCQSVEIQNGFCAIREQHVIHHG